MAVKITYLKGKEAEEASREMDEHIQKLKDLVDKQGGKSYEGFTIRDGKAVSLDEDD